MNHSKFYLSQLLYQIPVHGPTLLKSMKNEPFLSFLKKISELGNHLQELNYKILV